MGSFLIILWSDTKTEETVEFGKSLHFHQGGKFVFCETTNGVELFVLITSLKKARSG